MDEEGSGTAHDPAARLGQVTGDPDGIERLAGNPGAELPQRRDTGERRSAAAGDEPDPPPPWAARPSLSITPRVGAVPGAGSRSGTGPGAGKGDDDPPPPSPTRSGRGTYWAAAVFVVFLAIVGIGAMKARSDDTDPASTGASSDRETTTAADGPNASGARDATTASTSTTVPAPADRPPVVGECARIDAASSAQYLQVACDDPQAALQLNKVLPSPAPPGDHCPAGTDTVAQVTGEEVVAGGAAPAGAELWCLRNMQPPHTGDPGGGTGELVVGDCLGVRPDSRSIEVPCDGSGAAPEFVVGWMPDADGRCPSEAVASIDLQVPFAGTFCLKYF